MEQQEFQHIAAALRPRLLKLCTHFFDSQELAYEAEDAVQVTMGENAWISMILNVKRP